MLTLSYRQFDLKTINCCVLPIMVVLRHNAKNFHLKKLNAIMLLAVYNILNTSS